MRTISVLFGLLLAYLWPSATYARGEIPQDIQFYSTLIIQSHCMNDCSVSNLRFDAFIGDETAEDASIEVTVEPQLHGGFDYCLSYLEEQTCGNSPLNWSLVKGGHLTFPCGSHSQGFLIEALRAEYHDDTAIPLPSIWFAYSNGGTAVSEGETAAEVLPLFVCESPTQ